MSKKVAIIHDYLHQFGGAEKCVETWLRMYPEADLYTSIFTAKNFEISPEISLAASENRMKTSWLQFFQPFLKYFFKHFFWLYPIVMSFMLVKNYDLVIISSTFCAKNIKLENCNKIVHYCHSPTRFLHGMVTETDHQSLGGFYRSLIPFFIKPLKELDLRAVKYLNQKGCIWIANSKFIQQTISEAYQTDSVVIYPPTQIDKFLNIERKLSPSVDQEFYLCHGRISFHKRIDLAIKACLTLGKKLKIGGKAALQKEMDDLVQIVTDFEKLNPDKKGLIEFLGRTSDEQYFKLLQETRAFLFPGREDAGIAPIEAFASGCPVIAFAAGGALEYVELNLNGLLFEAQTVESLVEKILEFEKIETWEADKIKQTSQKFSEQNFVAEFQKISE